MQAVLYLAAQEKGTLVSAEDISKVLKIPREFISKILQNLRFLQTKVNQVDLL